MREWEGLSRILPTTSTGILQFWLITEFTMIIVLPFRIPILHSIAVLADLMGNFLFRLYRLQVQPLEAVPSRGKKVARLLVVLLVVLEPG